MPLPSDLMYYSAGDGFKKLLDRAKFAISLTDLALYLPTSPNEGRSHTVELAVLTSWGSSNPPEEG